MSSISSDFDLGSMLRYLVVLKTGMLREPLSTVTAYIKNLLHMDLLVNNQIGLASITFAALLALKWPLPRVDPFVEHQLQLTGESPPALHTHKRLFGQMSLLVAGKREPVTQTFPTLVTDINGAFRVEFMVGHQVGVATKPFAALVATIRPLSGMSSLVNDEMGPVTETFPALLAGIGLVTRVYPLV